MSPIIIDNHSVVYNDGTEQAMLPGFGRTGPTPLLLLVYNAARFGTDDEAASTLFGVNKGVYTGVDARAGLIERADGKALFLDEAHNYPRRIQKSLLRAMEEQRTARIGAAESTPVDVRYVFATNRPAPKYGLAHDLLARLRVVVLPPLKERVADIPSLFLCMAERALSRVGVQAGEADTLFTADHYESLCLHGFPADNTRGVIRVAEEIAEEIEDGLSPEAGVRRVFERHFGRSPVVKRGVGTPSFRETEAPVPSADLPADPVEREQAILAKAGLDQAALNQLRQVYEDCDGNVATMDKQLRSAHNVRYSRRRIARILDIAGLPRIKRGRA